MPDVDASPAVEGHRQRLGERSLAALVFALAALVRLPYLHQIPRYTDELTLWREAVALRGGAAWPMVFADTGYNGAWPIYLLAALRWLSGSLAGPRILALLVGSGIVLVTYLLGRELNRRRPGLLAAAFMGLSLTPVVVYSHVFHMIQAAALLQMLAWWLALRAVKWRSGRDLALAGLFVGLAIQTHPLTAAFVPGLAVWIWRQRKGRDLLSGRWGLAAGMALILAFSPIVLHHLPALGGAPGSRLNGVGEDLIEHWREIPPYGSAFVDLLRSWAAVMVGSSFDDMSVSLDAFLGSPYLALAMLAAVSIARRGQSLPLSLLASALVLMPLLMTEYRNTLPGRYAGLGLPLLYLALASWLADTVFATQRPRPRRAAIADSEGWIGLIIILLAILSFQLFRYYDGEDGARRTNEDFRRVVALVERERLPVVLDGGIKRTDGRGSGPSAVMHGLLEWRGIEVRKESDPEELRDYLLAISWPVVVIAADETFRTQLGFDPSLALDALDSPAASGSSLKLIDPTALVPPVSDTPGWSAVRFTPAGR